MSVSHLARMVADLAEGLPEDEAKKLEKVLRECCTQLAYFPIEEILKISDEWVFCNHPYDPTAFTKGVPPDLSDQNPVIEWRHLLYVFGSDGEMAWYWKLRNPKLKKDQHG